MRHGLRGNKDKLGILKAGDPYRILWLMRTNAGNYDLDTSDIIEKLTVWDAQYGLDLQGASHDWVQFKLRSLPNDLYSFAKEVYDFCPDSIEQGLGCGYEMMEEAGEGFEQYGDEVPRGLDFTEGGLRLMAAEIKRGTPLFLWWD